MPPPPLLTRHRSPRLQLLERGKREILAIPAMELEEWEERREKAARMVQAHWRGLVARRRFRQRSPERVRREKVRV